MGQKINPKSFRIGITKNWDSRWFAKGRKLPFTLEEDFNIRKYISKNLRNASVESVRLERLGSNLNVSIVAAKPGIIIGRGGKGAEKIKADLDKILGKVRKGNNIKDKYTLNVNVEEVKKPLVSSAVVAQGLAEDIEKRMPYRRAMKRVIEQVSQQKEAKGIKIKLSGRLDGAEISRTEWLDWGKMPLQTLRADIDYVENKAYCTYGIVGIKVWIYKGEVFSMDDH